MARGNINTTASLKGTPEAKAPRAADDRSAEERRAQATEDKRAAEAEANVDRQEDHPNLVVNANPTSRLHFKIFEQQVTIHDADDAGNPDKRLELTFSVDPGDSTKQKLKVRIGSSDPFTVDFPTGGAAAAIAYEPRKRQPDTTAPVDKVADAGSPAIDPDRKAMVTGEAPPPPVQQADPSVPGSGKRPDGSPFSPEQDTPGNPGAGNTSIDNRTGAQKD
jgi:hypothetical protein